MELQIPSAFSMFTPRDGVRLEANGRFVCGPVRVWKAIDDRFHDFLVCGTSGHIRSMKRLSMAELDLTGGVSWARRSLWLGYLLVQSRVTLNSSKRATAFLLRLHIGWRALP